MKNLNRLKVVSFIVLATTALNGCGYKDDMSKGYTTSSSKIADEYNIIKAEGIAQKYVENLINGKYSDNNSLFTERLKEEEKSKDYNKSFIATGYDAKKVNEFPDSTEFIYNISRCDLKRPYATLEEVKVKVINSDKTYQIDEVNSTIIREAFVEGSNVRLRSEDNVKSFLVIGKTSIPKYVEEENNPLSLQKIFLDNNQLQLLNFDYSGDHLSVVSKGNNAMVSSILIDQSQMVISTEGGKDSKKEEDKSFGEIDVLEDPVGKKVEVLKVIKDAKVDFCTYSRDNLYLITQYTKNNTKEIMINDIEHGNPIDFNFSEKFTKDKFNVEYLKVMEKGIEFKVYGRENTTLTEEDKKRVGVYQIEYLDRESLQKIS